MEDANLRNIFDPGWMSIRVSRCDSTQDQEERINKRAEFERQLYEEITTNLEKDMKESGCEVNYSAKILIAQVAMDLAIISRLKEEIVLKSIMQPNFKLKPDTISKPHPSGSKWIVYERIEEGETLNPVISDLLPKLERQVNHKLELLGLLPYQQRERQKIVLIEKMKRRLVDIQNGNNRYTADAIIEKTTE